jgi:hypothetical protein
MKKSIIEKIKAIFEEEKEEMVYMDIKTEDGKILRVTEMVIGGLIKELTEDGEVAIEGEVEFTTEEGFTVMVRDGVIEDIKEPVVEEEEPMVAEEAFTMDLVLEDGTPIQIDEQKEGILSAGDLVFVLDADGNRNAAPEGQHRVMGVGVITVDAEGKLVEVVEEVTEEVPTEVDSIDKIIEIIKEELLNQFNSLKSELDVIKEENKTLKERFNKFASEPSDEPTNTKVDFSKQESKNNKEDKLKFFSRK